MADIVTLHNIAGIGELARLSANVAATAGGAGDNVLVTGAVLDRKAFKSGMPNTAVIGIDYTTTLTATDLLSIGYTIYTSPDATNWTAMTTVAPFTHATGPTGGGTLTGILNIPVDLTMADRYIRFDWTPNLSAATVDTFAGNAIAFFSGFGINPAA